MTSPSANITFVSIPDSVAQCEEIRLGKVTVGSITRNDDGSAIKAWVRLNLPDLVRTSYPATSMKKAREIARRHIDEWVAEAGLLK